MQLKITANGENKEDAIKNAKEAIGKLEQENTWYIALKEYDGVLKYCIEIGE